MDDQKLKRAFMLSILMGVAFGGLMIAATGVPFAGLTGLVFGPVAGIIGASLMK